MDNRKTLDSITLPKELRLENSLFNEEGQFYLLSEKDRKAIIKELSSHPDGRYEKKRTGKKSNSGKNDPEAITIQDILRDQKTLYPVIKLNNKFYAMANMIGEGSYGQAKLAQDLETGEWYVIKILEVKNDEFSKDKIDQRKMSAKNEIEALKAMKLGTGNNEPIERRVQKPRGYNKTAAYIQFIIVMKYIPGELLAKIIKNERIAMRYEAGEKLTDEESIKLDNEKIKKLPVIDKFEIAAAFMKELLRIKQANYYHGDINPNNVKVNLATMQVSLLDYGSASPIATPATSPFTTPLSTPTTTKKGSLSPMRVRSLEDYEDELAFEANKPAAKPTPGTPGYRPVGSIARTNEKTEVHSALTSIAQLLGFAEMKERSGVVSLKWVDRNKVKDAYLLEAYDFIKSVVSSTLEDEIKKAIEKELSALPEDSAIPDDPEKINDYFNLQMQREIERSMLEDKIKKRVTREYYEKQPNIEEAYKKFDYLYHEALRMEKIQTTMWSPKFHHVRSPSLERKQLVELKESIERKLARTLSGTISGKKEEKEEKRALSLKSLKDIFPSSPTLKKEKKRTQSSRNLKGMLASSSKKEEKEKKEEKRTQSSKNLKISPKKM